MTTTATTPPGLSRRAFSGLIAGAAVLGAPTLRAQSGNRVVLGQSAAFTGAAADRDGFFQAANGGTLFLDEIGDLRLDLQAKLLRSIQEGEIERVGGTKPIKTDFRLIAATNLDL